MSEQAPESTPKSGEEVSAAFDDVENGDEFAGEEVEPEHDVDVSQFAEDEDDDE